MFLKVEDEVNLCYTNSHRKEVLEKIQELINYLSWVKVWNTPIKEFQYYTVDELTRLWWKLAIYQYNLIEYEIEAFKNTKKAELMIDSDKQAIRRTILEHKSSTEKLTETDIKIKTDSMLVKSELVKWLHEAELNRLTALKFSIWTIIWRLESRIKYLLSDINTKFKNEE